MSSGGHHGPSEHGGHGGGGITKGVGHAIVDGCKNTVSDVLGMFFRPAWGDGGGGGGHGGHDHGHH